MSTISDSMRRKPHLSRPEFKDDDRKKHTDVLEKLKLDEQHFVDWSRSVIFMSKELVMLDGPVSSAADRRR